MLNIIVISNYYSKTESTHADMKPHFIKHICDIREFGFIFWPQTLSKVTKSRSLYETMVH